MIAKMLARAVQLLETPYIWWAKGELAGRLVNGRFERWRVSDVGTVRAYDCAGFVTSLTYEFGAHDLRWTHNTDALWVQRPAIELGEVQPGDLAFYGGKAENDVDHVMLVLSVIHLDRHPVQVLVVGASGGGRRTLTPTPGAEVKVYASHLYRRDFRGFRRGLLR